MLQTAARDPEQRELWARVFANGERSSSDRSASGAIGERLQERHYGVDVVFAQARRLPRRAVVGRLAGVHVGGVELGDVEADPKRAYLSPKRVKRWFKLLYFTPALFPLYFRAAARAAAGYPEALRARLRRERAAVTLAHLALMAGIAIPLAAREAIGGGRALTAAILLLSMAGGAVLARFGERVEGWRLSLAILALFVLYSVAR